MLKLLLLTISLVAVTSLYPYAEQDHIINLGAPTWETANNEFPNGLLVYFYEPTCFPCRRFWPELQNAAKTLFDATSQVHFAKLECHDEVNLCNQLGVTSFPTIKLFRSGRDPYEYRGLRTARALTSWIKAAVDGQYETVESEEELFRRHSVAILTESGSDAITQVYHDLLDDIAIAKPGETLKGKIGPNAGAVVTQGGQVVPIAATDNSVTLKNRIVGILNSERTSVPNFNLDMVNKLQGQESHDFVVFLRTNKFSAISDAAKGFDQAANEIKNNLIFAYANVPDDLHGEQLAKHFGVAIDDEPAVGIISKKGAILRKYKLTEPITFENVKKFVSDFQAGSAQRYYMSAEVPKTDYDYIKELVGKNYHEVTQDSSHYVFVMFYFPWCEDCVKLEPTWKSLAYRLRHTDNVIIAQIDVSENDVKDQEITEFPTLLLYPLGREKNPVKYTGERNIKNLKVFLSSYIPTFSEAIEL